MISIVHAPAQRQVPPAAPRAISAPFLWICGVILPLIAIFLEANVAICANFIDPMPAPTYLIVLVAVPVCNALAWFGLRRDLFHRARWLAAMAGFGAAVACFYTVLMAPMIMISAIALIILIGIIGFAPVLALWTSIRLARAWAGFTGWRPVLWGGAAGFTALLLLASPEIGLRAGGAMIESRHQWVRETGYSILHLAPVRGQLLDSCDRRSREADARGFVAWITGRGALTSDDARSLYYRVTGQAYDQQPQSRWRARSWNWLDDPVTPRATPDVELTASRLDGKIDPRGATAYLEWTMTLHNNGALQREARTEVALPSGGVVSRVTLWVDGEEHEAAFGGGGQVRQAYNSVVQARRDPLLVTSSGRDRVQVQCFPVPPAGDMKIRIGVTAPILPEGLTDRGIVALPSLITQNFQAKQPSWAWVESAAPMTASAKFKLMDRGSIHIVRGPLATGEQTAIRIAGIEWPSTWTADPADGSRAIEQRFVERPVQAPERAVVVVDGSESMRPLRAEINAALDALPATMEKRIVMVTRTGASAWLPEMPWGGGVDALPALEQALCSADGVKRTAVVWVAGTQPVKIAGIELLRQILERSDGEAKLAVLAAGGENVILRELDGLPGLESIPRAGSVAEGLRTYFARWQPGARERIVERRSVPASQSPADAPRASSHVVRLWAAQEAGRTASTNRPHAVEVAVAHQIVTPFTGAVVLETAEQYERNGLEPAKSGSTPNVTPEPRTWILIAIGVFVLMALRARAESRRRTR